MNFQLDPQSESIITAQVSSGHFADAEAVIKESLRLLEKREKQRQELRDHIDCSLASPNRYTGEEVMENVRARLRRDFPA